MFADAWHASNTAPRRNSAGSSCTCSRARIAIGLPAFYTLHVWAWKPNPTGAFVNWHSDVSCENFAGQEH